MNQQELQKEIFRKIDVILSLCDEINKEISKKLISKARFLQVELTQDLQEKCSYFLTEPIERNSYRCKICDRVFDDGRKLGGHISRAHKASPKKKKGINTKKDRQVKKSRQLKCEDDSEYWPECKMEVEEDVKLERQ